MKKLEELKVNIGAMCMWEQVMDRPFEMSGKLTDIVVLMYCVRKQCDKDFGMELEDYMGYISDHPTEWSEAVKWIAEQLRGPEDVKPSKGKKKGKEL